ncbi:MAG: hypothetical protein AVDCRST_MAG32-1395, partial [uncultured Nocardioides sp.]
WSGWRAVIADHDPGVSGQGRATARCGRVTRKYLRCSN